MRTIFTRTDLEIIVQTNELARKLAKISGWEINENFVFFNSINPRAKMYWDFACEAQLELSDTDPMDVLDNNHHLLPEESLLDCTLRQYLVMELIKQRNDLELSTGNHFVEYACNFSKAKCTELLRNLIDTSGQITSMFMVAKQVPMEQMCYASCHFVLKFRKLGDLREFQSRGFKTKPIGLLHTN